MAQSALYGGTFGALTHDFTDLGIAHTLVSGDNPALWATALRPETKVFYAEAITNPLLEARTSCIGDIAWDIRRFNVFGSSISAVQLQMLSKIPQLAQHKSFVALCVDTWFSALWP